MTHSERRIADIVETISHDILRPADPGELAALRRMDPRVGAPLFWRLTAREPLHDIDTWATIVRIMAILTRKGRPEDRRTGPHDSRHPLGKALCDGGGPAWTESGAPRPVYSESRLARLLAARNRAVLLERAARMLARTKDPDRGLDCAQIALLLLTDDPAAARQVSRDYYRRLDRAQRTHDTQEQDDEETAA